LPATPEMRIIVPKQLEAMIEAHESTPITLGGHKVERISTLDGTKFFLENDNWALMRFSGTEPVLRIFSEADTEEMANQLIDALKVQFDLKGQF